MYKLWRLLRMTLCNGPLGFVLVAMIRRVVCYYLSCVPCFYPKDEFVKGFIGLFCPCYLFAKNAEFLGSETLTGPCMTHFLLWALINVACCFYCILLGLPSCLLSCYACNYRKNLRTKYNLPEAPCGDFVTHLFCHQCALCQEYREICERSGDPNFADIRLPVVSAPPVQKMEPHSGESL